jgi:lipopolysaccharide export system protein LptA
MWAGAASAEKADALKDLAISARKVNLDKAAGQLAGDVQLRRGTLAMDAEFADIAEAADGWRVLTLTAAPGKFATFRQKSDAGPEVWTEGRAHRIAYDEKTDVVKLFHEATVKTTDRGLLKSQLDGELLILDDRSQNLTAINNANGIDTPNGGRSTVTLAARGRAAPTAAAAPRN